MDWRSSAESTLDRTTVVLSVNSLTFRDFLVPRMGMPVMRVNLWMASASGSIAMSKRRHDRVLPCRTPLSMTNGWLSLPFIITITGGKGLFTQWVHCGYIVNSG